MLAAMTTLDWTIVAAYMTIVLAIGLLLSRRAGKSTNEFFLSGRNLPWWLAGTSMVATSFSADTPLLITGWTRQGGIAGNWIWWAWATGGMLSVFLLSRLWRRAEVMTDIELTELRYGGSSAAVLRGFKAAYTAVVINCIRIAMPMAAMMSILSVLLGIDPVVAIAICAVVTTIYCVLSGLWGVIATDFVQFFMAMAGSIALCIFVVGDHGGLSALRAEILSVLPADSNALSFIVPPVAPGDFWRLDFWSAPFVVFIVLLTVQWWGNMNADGGGLIIQRMSAAKNERHSLLATLWFNVAHHAVRPWPWILVALASLVAIPNLPNPANPGEAYALMIRDFAPPGLMGLMVATFLAAFMSTMDTQLNLSSAYIVNDFYRRFIRPKGPERHYVMISRLASVVVMIIGVLIAVKFTSVLNLWNFLISFSSGVGLIFLLRWFWWRINAWSEVSAMVTSSVVAIGLQFVKVTGPQGTPVGLPFTITLLVPVAASAIVSLIVTLLTRPVDMHRLVQFYRKVRPFGFWGPVAALAGVKPVRGLGTQLLNWIAATIMVFGMTFSIGKFLLCEPLDGILWLIAAIAGAAVIWRELSRNSTVPNEHKDDISPHVEQSKELVHK